SDPSMNKLFCCNESAELKRAKSEEGSKKNGVTTTQPDATWRVGEPLAAENGIGVEPVRRNEHVELTRLTSDASRLNDPKIEPDDDLDPNVIEEVSHEDLARYSNDSPFTPRDSSGQGTSNDSFHEVDLNAKDDQNTARSIEEVAREYNRSKREILDEIEREEEEVQAVLSNKITMEPLDLSSPPQSKAENEIMQVIASDSVLSQIEAEFKEIIEEVDEESDEELKRTMNERVNASHHVLREVMSREEGGNEKKKESHDDVDSPSPASSATGEEGDRRGVDSRTRVLSSFDDDSDVEHLLDGMDTDRTNSTLPPPPPQIDTASSSMGTAMGPLSSSSGFATSTMYSAASDDSDVSDGEQIPENKRVFDISSDEGTAGHEKTTVLDDIHRDGTRLSLKSTGEATVASGEIRVNLHKEKSITVTDEEFPEKLV
ncbi:hypothetical protein PMAYCL1PPCAC_18024, partial [Pristionchus mayeri]